MDTKKLNEIYEKMLNDGNFEIIEETRRKKFFNRIYKYKNYLVETGGIYAKDSHNKEYEELEEVYNINIIK